MKILLFLLLPFFSIAQNSDWKELQKLIDDARYSATGIVEVKRNYTIDAPLVVRDNGQVSLSIIGYATMWDNNKRSVITATFKDHPILSIQRGKGCVIKGINFQGAGSDGTDTRTNVYAAIAIDPFNDGTRSGSTGITIEHCTFNRVVAGVTTSINGYTQNAELITIQNCRSYDVKYFMIGTQAQEKLNRIINVGIWGPTHTAFMFNHYGSGTPGHWIIDGVNIAGSVDNLIFRRSGGYFPVMMSNVFAESLGSLGTWQSGVGDRLSNSTINFRYKEQQGHYPVHLYGEGLTIENTTLRYYGRRNEPILIKGRAKLINNITYLPPIVGRSMYDKSEAYEIKRLYQPGTVSRPVDGRARVTLSADSRNPPVSVGDIAVIMHPQSWWYEGMAVVDSVYDGGFTIKYATPLEGSYYGIGIYKVK